MGPPLQIGLLELGASEYNDVISDDFAAQTTFEVGMAF